MPQRARARASAGVAALLALPLLAGSAAAETAWVRGEIRLNVRSGAGTENRIIGGLRSGDAVEVLERGESWTRVRLADDREGWIPAGYLEREPPPSAQLEELQLQARRLRARLATLERESARLRRGNEELEARDAERRAEIERLAAENTSLRAGARWPELIAGAAILAAGMLVGASLARTSARRSSRRIKI